MPRHPGCGVVRTVTQRYDGEPDWEPLEAAVGLELAALFMWMGVETLEDGSRVQAYKHSSTRRYLHLGDDDTAYATTPCGWLAPLRMDFAIQRALCSWWLLSGGTDEVRDQISAAVQAASERGHGLGDLGW